MQMSRKSPKSSILITTASWLAIFAFSHGALAASNSLSAYVYDSSTGTWDPDVNESSSVGPVSYGIPAGSTPAPPPQLTGFPNQGDVAGSADFGVLKAQAYASANGDPNRTASIDVGTNFTVNVVAAATPPVGSPGLVIGDSVSLSLSMRLDGILNSGAGAGSTGSVEVNADLTISEAGAACGGEGGCPDLMNFNANANSITWGSSSETSNSWSWTLTTATDNQSDSDSWIIGPGSTCLGPTCYDIDFDTGILTTTIDTSIGASLDILGSLYIYAQGTSFGGEGAYGSADFLDTYGLVLTPLTEGVELDYGGIIPAEFDPGTTVPIPPAVWLFGSGLIGMIGIARRKQA